MYIQVGLITAGMILGYGLTKWKFSVQASMLAAAVTGGMVGAIFNTPPISQLARHLAEGTFTYLDVALIFITATVFMDIVDKSGGIDYLVRGIMEHFSERRILALLLLMLIVFIPGALTGAGSVALLVVGAPVALALKYLGISKVRSTAILFILAGLSAAAPPVNVWAMITCAGAAIPYVGFELPLALPIILLGTFTVLVLGWKGESADKEQILSELSEVPEGMTLWKVLAPFLVFVGLLLAYRIWPFQMPIMGLPLDFTIAALTAWAVSPKSVNILELSRKTVKRLLGLISIVIIVGVLQQVMTATGVRGMLAFGVISTPLLVLYILLAFVIPISEGLFTYGGAAVLGIPLVWFFNSVGLHATIAIAGLTLLFPLGDALPPTALIGRLSVMVSDYEGSYWRFVRETWLPWLVITATGILMVVYSNQLSFLVEWST